MQVVRLYKWSLEGGNTFGKGQLSVLQVASWLQKPTVSAAGLLNTIVPDGQYQR